MRLSAESMRQLGLVLTDGRRLAELSRRACRGHVTTELETLSHSYPRTLADAALVLDAMRLWHLAMLAGDAAWLVAATLVLSGSIDAAYDVLEWPRPLSERGRFATLRLLLQMPRSRTEDFGLAEVDALLVSAWGHPGARAQVVQELIDQSVILSHPGQPLAWGEGRPRVP